MMRLLDRIGELFLWLLRLVFLNREARAALGEDGGKRKAAKRAGPKRASVAGADGARQALIARAVSVHRSQQEVLSQLDEKSRSRLRAMAKRMMGEPPKKN